ncbi:MAG: 23S rRNA (uracil(1939)-C(5))-methyltransferase RlmD [Syntrophomonadaceae bacterium]|jgi:23S rRNA (uracil1939-C5)-methyltransferase
MKCKIEGITQRGEGVARINGKATFIPYAVPGEEVGIRITEDRKKYSRAEIIEIITASPDRVKPPCPHYYKCGGCVWQHIKYERQLQIKQQLVKDALTRIGKIETEVMPVIGMDNPWNYRNKVTWHIGKTQGELKLGYYRANSQEFLPIQECNLLQAEIAELSRFLNCYLFLTVAEPGKQIIIRQGSADQKLMLIIEGPVDRKALINLMKGYPNLESLLVYEDNQLELLTGKPYVNFQIDTYKYQVSPLAFFQVNNQQAERLYQLVKENLGNNQEETVLDAYCGTGSIALYISKNHQEVIGVEAFAESIQDANNNARLNNIHNCQFYAGKCEQIIPVLEQQFDTIILDPPRSGCHPDLLNSIIEKSPLNITYVSCNPATLARDLAFLTDNGYIINKVQPVDMFPQAGHVECVVLMSRVEK